MGQCAGMINGGGGRAQGAADEPMREVVARSTTVKRSPRNQVEKMALMAMVMAAMAEARDWPSSANTASDIMEPANRQPRPSSHRGSFHTGFSGPAAASRRLCVDFCRNRPVALVVVLSSATHTPPM